MNPIQKIRGSLINISKSLPAVTEEIASPDDKTMIANIIEMLKQILGANQMPEADTEPSMEPVMEELADTSEELSVKKEKKVDAKIGDENVNNRLEDQTPVTNNAMQEINKSLSQLTALLAGQKIQKTIEPKKDENEIAKSLKAITTVMKGLEEKQNQQEQAITGFMKQIGVSDEIVQKALITPSVNMKPENRPNQKNEMMSFMTEFMKAFNKKENQKNWGNNHGPWGRDGEVRKSLDPVLDSLFTKRR